MKIAIICYNHFDVTISLGKYLAQIDKNVEVHFIFLLSQSYLNIEIISLKGKHLNNGFVDKKILSEVIDKEIFDYLKDEISFDVFIFNSYKFADLKNFKLLFELKTFILDKKYDVLHFEGNNRWVILLNSLFRKIPKIHTLHEPYPFSKISRYKLLRHKWKISLLIHSKSHITVPSITSYNRFNTYFHINSDSVSIIPFGPLEIYKEYSKDVIVKQNNVILYYGYISAYKGIEILISAMELISKSNPGLKLIIAGAGEFNYDISPSISNLEVINRHLSNKEIAELNKLANIVVCPYTSASQSGVVMTSFAFDNPIVATNVGALPEFIEDGVTGVIIEPGNPEILYKTIINLFEDLSAIDKMRANVSDKYSNSEKSWKNTAAQTYQLYKKQITS